MARVYIQKPFNRTKHVLLSPFSKGQKNKAKITELPLPLQLIFRHIVLSDDGKLLFVKNSKAGCTTASHLLYEYSRGQKFVGKIHTRQSQMRGGVSDFEAAKNALNDPNTYKFTIVRDPQKRAISCFKDFFIDKTNIHYPKHARAIEAFGFRDDGVNDHNFAAFIGLVEASVAKSADYTDPHFRTQVKNTAFGTVDYQKICKLENFYADITQVFQESGAGFPGLAAALEKKHNPTKSTKYIPSEELQQRVRDIYADDYAAFGY